MRRKRVHILPIILMLTMVALSGCGKEKDEKKEEEKVSSITQMQTCWEQDSEFTACETGYYYIDILNGLSYFDKNSKKSIVLNAMKQVGEERYEYFMNHTIRYANDKLYYVYADTRKGYYIYTANKDGSNEESLLKLFECTAEDDISIHFEIQNGYAYYAVTLLQPGDTMECNFKLYRVKLEKDAVSEMIFEVENTEDYKTHYISKITAVDEKLYFISKLCKSDTEIDQTLMCYDIPTGETETIDTEIVCGRFAATKDSLYYFKKSQEQYDLLRYDLATKQIATVKNNVPEEQVGELSSDGNYLYSRYDLGLIRKHELDTKYLYIFDFKGEVVDQIDTENNRIIEAYFGDEDYLVLEQESGENQLQYMLYDKTQIGTDKWELIALGGEE